MLNAENIHNSAIMRPGLAKRPQKMRYCDTRKTTGRHAFVGISGKPSQQQCIDCGTIIFINRGYRHGIYN